jgi:Metallo-peptidase family M12B Reprolysin-like/Secretion system C-terminal sorting domain
MRKLVLTLFTVVCCTVLSAQNRFFTDAGTNTTIPTNGQRVIVPQSYRAASLDMQAMKNFLWSLPSEKNILTNRNATPIIELPMPDGKMAKFHVWESSIQEPGLEAKFPDIKTFVGQGIDDPYATIRMDYSPFGFHAQVLTVNGSYYIDPYARGEVNNYISYFRTDLRKAGTFLCEVPDNPTTENLVTEAACRGTELRTYRLAVACTGEYAQAPGISAGTNPAILHAAIVTTVNRVVGVYEKEIAVRLVLVANNNLVEFLNAGTDPFNGNNNANTLINESQVVIDANIGSANYDIGHTFSTGGGGLAQLNSPCGPSKARGITGSGSPTGDAYDIDYVAHEMGHQFGGNHSMAGCGSSPNSTKYEVGSGTTIQAYAGICDGENIQPNSDPYFHAISFDEISNFLSGSGSSCGVLTTTGNNIPVIGALTNNNLSIPIRTPFTLTGTATDPDGDALTYNWEQWDFSGTRTWNSGATATAGNTDPLFKSRIPKTTGSRTFPDIAVILAGYPVNPAATMGGLKGETLSPVSRPMKFKLTVRDNKAGGGGVTSSGAGGCQSSTVFQVNVVSTPGPFALTSPNGGESYFGGSSQTITWDVVNTNLAPINVANVKISLSTDGGQTYPTVITNSTPNDGSEVLTIPAVVSTTARIKVEAVGNIFFDISNANFIIATAPNGFTFTTPAPVVSACPAAASMQSTLNATYNGSFITPIILSASGNPAGTTVSFGTNPLTTATTSSTVTLNGTNTLSAGTYTVVVTGIAGPITQTVNVLFTITAGTGPTIISSPSPQSICAGSDATFTVGATGTYQWQVSTAAVPAFTNISGATSASYTVTGATTGLNGNQYRCVVSSQCGSTNSNPATLTVSTPPSVITNPQSVTLCAGSNNTFNVGATGSGLTYQWQVSTAAVPTFTDISGATSASYAVTGITAGMSGNQYRCVVSGTCTPAANSAAATLTVVTAVTVTSQPTSTAVCVGGNTSFTVAGSGSGIIYQWQVDAGAGFVNAPNAAPYTGVNSATLTITGATTTLNTYQYRCQLSNATCTTPGVSDAAILTVNTLPAISNSPAAVTICEGASNTFSVTATGTAITYQWQISTPAAPAFVDIAAATTNSYTVTGVTAGMNGNKYHCIVSGVCTPSVTSADATLTVISPVVVSTQPVAAEICSGSNTSFTVAGTSSQPISYQWQVSTTAVPAFTNILGATGATLSITAAPTSLSGNQYRAVLTNTTCTAPVASAAVVLTVRQLPTVGLTAAPYLSLLPGQSTTLTATPSAQTTGTLTTSWTRNGTPITNAGNTRVVNVENIGTYRINIQEVFSTGRVCSNQSADVVIDATASSRLFIFPSPNNGQFTVSYYNNGGSSTTRTVTLYDSKGSRVHYKSFPVAGLYTLIPIDVRSAQKGIYYVVVGDAAGKKLAEGKVVVQ